MTESNARRAFHTARAELQTAITDYQSACAQAQRAQADMHQAMALLETAMRAFDPDPEASKLRALLQAWHGTFGSKPATVGAAIQMSRTQAGLAMAMDDIAGQNGRLNARILGRWLLRVQGRIADGMCFARVGLRQGLLHWAVYCPQDEATAQVAMSAETLYATPRDLAARAEGAARFGRTCPCPQRAGA
ncbi:hypothetical protein [Pseudorhodoferax sp.]|uniref:hypothetical protein n=1 Tax=Pseudorhodoferax sp. TaxID=1993553 RepID=UPI002DD6782B|nr:hypothetical protein [Pseudorhodoferax sp.]